MSKAMSKWSRLIPRFVIAALVISTAAAFVSANSAEAKDINAEVTFSQTGVAGDGTTLEGVGTSPSATGQGALVTGSSGTPPMNAGNGIFIEVQMKDASEVDSVLVSIGGGFVVD